MAWNIPSDWSFKEAPGAAKLNTEIRDNLNYLKASLPAGVMMDYGGATAPDQWLLCDGSAISRSTYAALFTAIGVLYGVGNGTTTFNIPDRRGRVSVMKSTDTEFDTLGESGGEKTHALIESELAIHTHAQDAHTHVQNAHTHTQNAHTHNFKLSSSGTTGGIPPMGNTYSGLDSNPTNDSVATNQDTVATNQNTTATNQNTGAGTAHNNLQPYLVSNAIIKY